MTYEYAYVDCDGQHQVVTRDFPMGMAPPEIAVDGDPRGPRGGYLATLRVTGGCGFVRSSAVVR